MIAPIDVCIDNIEAVYELNNKMLEVHLKNRETHSKLYKESFENILRQNACNFIDFSKSNLKVVTTSECE